MGLKNSASRLDCTEIADAAQETCFRSCPLSRVHIDDLTGSCPLSDLH